MKYGIQRPSKIQKARLENRRESPDKSIPTVSFVWPPIVPASRSPFIPEGSRKKTCKSSQIVFNMGRHEPAGLTRFRNISVLIEIF